MVKIIVNGKELEAPEGKPLIDFLREIGEHIPGFCYTNELDPYGSCRLCLVSTPRGVTTSCTLKPMEGLKIETLSDEVVSMRKTALELILSDHYGDCIGPCQDGCPAHSDVQGYLALIAMGKYHEAVKLMKEKYILPAVLGRVCPAFCEEACRRNLVDEPLAIRQLKRFAADYDLEHGPWMPEIPPSTGKRIAVVGGGPAGLACAYYLRTMGHEVTIIEAMPELGGMMRYGIPPYRLPRDVLDRDIATVMNTGIEVKTNTALGRDVTLEELRESYDAVFLGVGAWRSRKMGIPGEELEGVMHGIEFLRKVNMGEKVELGERVIVVGGGNTAMDVARTALRLGAKVTVVYRRSKAEMPANEREVEEAMEEGVEFMFLTNPVRILGDGRVEEVELVKMKLGEPDSSGRRRPIPIEGSEFRVKADNVILAIGQYCDEGFLNSLGIEAKRGKAVVDEVTLQTSIPGVFAGGDLVLGPSTVIESIATGRRAAIMIDLYLKGKLDKAKAVLTEPEKHIEEVLSDDDLYRVLFDLRPYNHWKRVTEKDYEGVERKPRAKVKLLEPERRKKTFDEVEPALSEEEVLKEAQRCMSCGCMEVFRCKLREYATLYGAEQHAFEGEGNKFEIDESHQWVTLDNNKCVLCGQCVRFTHEVAGEGVLDYLFRGFATRIGPPLGDKMADLRGSFIGELADVCPVGAITEKLPFVKPGPWKTKPVKTVCNGCSFACEMNVEVYDGMLVRASSIADSWNRHICDHCRFDRPWAEDLTQPLLNGKPVSWEEAKRFIAERSYALILSPDLTNEEIAFLKAFAERKGVTIGSTASGSPSTATLEDVRNAKRVLLKADPEKFPLLKILLRGKEIVEENYDLAVLEGPAEPLEVPTLILHEGVNAAGLLKAGVKGIPESEAYVVIGRPGKELPGDVLVIPAGVWAEKSGTVTNALGMELKMESAREGYSPLGLFE
ncbi:glutamate synthase beta chain-related oxidoreductase containing 2Fe-2S and 4Fe-4S clusters [Thermococcus cleftensis]|uniref:Glutamate synthase beta chain-related oxidoreductase containing 2Fe-2S and 4Fe-4S clusters n=1 Tax=Thermococcus cleftensis (strain DSM 27260 / KACC 17922 / CL1) TaxID=163003 RepID=I3ZT10_THECF|nr:NAD(P)-binding protein [Thermococcus cleftensis]AFL94844.1 glutamate synthase beta chain-related oxidoreductase containing 2Fe-2S and 4Fe-4S clusters [Thermococcus cleftensis]